MSTPLEQAIGDAIGLDPAAVTVQRAANAAADFIRGRLDDAPGLDSGIVTNDEMDRLHAHLGITA